MPKESIDGSSVVLGPREEMQGVGLRAIEYNNWSGKEKKGKGKLIGYPSWESEVGPGGM